METTDNGDKELLYSPAHELLAMMREKRLSPVELVDALLRRIQRLNPELSAYITVDEDGARKAAKVAADSLSRGEDLPPLHGLPISVKDTIATRGLRTTSGSVVLRDFVPDADDPVVTRLKEAGAIIIGKTNVPEFANAFSGENELTDPCRNPWLLERSCSGSSSGAAAAVAAGIGPIGLGTDGGGSIRSPAGACGVFGLKPTTTVTRIPFAPDPSTGRAMNFVSHGPITRNVTDAALAMGVLSGPLPGMYNCIRSDAPDFVDVIRAKPRPLRIAWSADLGYVNKEYGLDAEYLDLVERAAAAFENMGHVVEPANPPTGNPIPSWEKIVTAEVVPLLGPIYDQDGDKMAIYNRHFVQFARSLSGEEVAGAFLDMERWRAEMDLFFENYDLLLSPVLAYPPQPIGAVYERSAPERIFQYEFCPFTQLFNLTGSPAASLPCGFTSAGLPVGMQVTAARGDELTVLAACAQFERQYPWAHLIPALA